jgi:hypothetical protein
MSTVAKRVGGIHLWRLIGWGLAALALLAPLLAMQFTCDID